MFTQFFIIHQVVHPHMKSLSLGFPHHPFHFFRQSKRESEYGYAIQMMQFDMNQTSVGLVGSFLEPRLGKTSRESRDLH